jgi:hypothetical protein
MTRVKVLGYGTFAVPFEANYRRQRADDEWYSPIPDGYFIEVSEGQYEGKKGWAPRYSVRVPDSKALKPRFNSQVSSGGATIGEQHTPTGKNEDDKLSDEPDQSIQAAAGTKTATGFGGKPTIKPRRTVDQPTRSQKKPSILTGPGAGHAADLPSGTEVRYDKFHDYTAFRLVLGEFENNQGTHSLVICAYHAGKEPRAADTVWLWVGKSSPNWEYLKYHDVVVMCGDDRIKSESTYDSETNTKVNPGVCHEYIHIDLSVAGLQAALDKDQDLEIKIGAHEPFKLGPQIRGKMSEFTKAVRSGDY